MHARSTTIRGRPESVDEGIAFCRDEVLPMCREMSGCVGLSLIADRGSGRCIVTTSWDSIESMSATTNQNLSVLCQMQVPSIQILRKEGCGLMMTKTKSVEWDWLDS